MSRRRLLSVRDDSWARARALLIARAAIALYLVELLLNLIRPHLMPGESALSIFYKLPGDSGSWGQWLSMPGLVFWFVLAGIVAGAAVQVYAALTRRRGGTDDSGRRAVTLTWITLGCLLLPFGLISVTPVFEFFPIALLCLPTTALALLLLRALIRFARVSWTALLLAFAWGALIVFGLGRAYTSLAFGTLYGYLGQKSGTGLGSFTKGLDRTTGLVIVHLSLVNALVVAAGVALLLTLLRHRVTDAVTGLVLGAAVGVGYNFVESVLVIKLFGSLGFFLGATSGFEYWIRQAIGLFGGQVTFGALVGAAIGAASAGARGRGVIVGAGLLAAVGGGTAAETLSGWMASELGDGVRAGSVLDTLVVSPFFWLLPQLPFFALAVALLVTGLRSRAPALRAAVAAETGPAGPITQAEEPVLVSPVLRFWALAGTWRTHGRTTALTLHRLQSDQLDLASWRAQNDPEAGPEGDELRARVMRRKGVREVTS